MARSAGHTSRCDAEVNRARIVAFARSTLDKVPETTLRSIARGAGVGQGTMYRHFPSRGDLLLDVYGSEIQHLADMAGLLAAEHEPVAALRLWLERLAAFGGLDTALSHAVEAATLADTGGPHHARLREALDGLLEGCRASDRLRPDVAAGDVLLLMSYVWRAGGGVGRHGSSGCDLLGIVIDGLLAGGRS